MRKRNIYIRLEDIPASFATSEGTDQSTMAPDTSNDLVAERREANRRKDITQTLGGPNIRAQRDELGPHARVRIRDKIRDSNA